MMSNTIEVISTNVSTTKGTVKEPALEISIDNNGVVGDAHAGQSSRQVSIIPETRFRERSFDSDHFVTEQ